MIIITEYSWRFDPVEFGIDLRQWRSQNGLKQIDVDAAVGVNSKGSYTSAVEAGRTPVGISMHLFLSFCDLMDADPRKYFSIEQK